jgi:hypothetical protein
MAMATTASTSHTDALRAQLVEFLRGGSAHVDPKTALAGLKPEHYGAKVDPLPHTPWQLLEHIRFTVRDLLEFCTNANYVAPEWPEDYWPSSASPAHPQDWKKSADALLDDLSSFESLIEDTKTDLEAKIPWGQGQTILREALLAIDHTSYHLGQLVLVRQLLKDWKH